MTSGQDSHSRPRRLPVHSRLIWKNTSTGIDSRSIGCDPVAHEIISELYDLIPDFRKAYDVDGMTPNEFDVYGATVQTSRGFIASHHELIRVIREDSVLPNPDRK